MKRKIFVVGTGSYYSNWMEGKTTYWMEDADLVVFTGGEDVCPDLYGCKTNKYTSCNRFRDDREVAAFERAMKLGKKMIGICRGAQLLCVLAGGTLVQDQQHPTLHKMLTNQGSIWVTSLHHQRQYPWGRKQPKFELLGWCDKLSPYSIGEDAADDMSGRPEVEIARYPDINALAIQSHPEFAFPPKHGWERRYIRFCQDILDRHMEK